MKKIIILFLFSFLLVGCEKSNLITVYLDNLTIKESGITLTVDTLYETESNFRFHLVITNTGSETFSIDLADLLITRLSNQVGYPINIQELETIVTVASNSSQTLYCIVVLPTSIEIEHYRLTFGHYVYNLYEQK